MQFAGIRLVSFLYIYYSTLITDYCSLITHPFMKPRYLIHEPKDSILSFLSHTTGIEYDDIRFHGIDHLAQSCRHEYHIDLFTVSIVHLTAEGFDVESFYLHLTE